MKTDEKFAVEFVCISLLSIINSPDSLSLGPTFTLLTFFLFKYPEERLLSMFIFLAVFLSYSYSLLINLFIILCCLYSVQFSDLPPVFVQLFTFFFEFDPVFNFFSEPRMVSPPLGMFLSHCNVSVLGFSEISLSTSATASLLTCSLTSFASSLTLNTVRSSM